MYSNIRGKNENDKTAKGIKTIAIKNDIKHEDYKSTPFNNKQMYHTMKTIYHQLGSYELK